MVSVADTRLLLTIQFPAGEIIKARLQAFLQKELARGVIVPSIVLSEFMKIAGARIGIQATAMTINALKERGVKIGAINEELAIEAGKLLLKHRDVPFADSLVGAFVSGKIGEYVLSDDPHFEAMGVRARWLSS